jgi:hypothetical protein
MMPWFNQASQPALIITSVCDGGFNPRLNRFNDEALLDPELIILEGLKHSVLVEAGEPVTHHQIDFVQGLTTG